MGKSLFIPNNKHDLEAVERINKAELSDIQEVLPQICELLEDINWPVAKELVKVLVKFDEAIMPFVIDLINKPDGLREYNVYNYMLPLLSENQLRLLREELERVAYSPSPYEKEEELDVIALEYLQKIH